MNVTTLFLNIMHFLAYLTIKITATYSTKLLPFIFLIEQYGYKSFWMVLYYIHWDIPLR